MDQLERIQYYEELMNKVSDAVRQLEAAGKAFDRVSADAEELGRYLGSPEWRQDFEADAEGQLPKDLRRGVLSEDGLYNLLEDYRELEKERNKKNEF